VTTDAPPRPLSDAAVKALRDIYEHGTDTDRARARGLLVEHGYIVDPLVEQRARIRAGGPMLLGEELMPDTVYGARSPLHDFLNDWHLAEASQPPGARCATAAPRGHGKSTAGVELAALYHAAYCTRRFQLIVSDTDDQAIARIAAIKAAAETNDELRELFPKLRPAQPGRWAQADGDDEGGVWRERDIVFACGCRISARGAGTSIRGMKHRERRPDLVYLDDLEDEKSVATPYQIKKRLGWLQRVVMGLAGHGEGKGLSILWVGTILTRDALLNLATGAALDEAQERPSWARLWRPKVFRAELDGTPRERVTVTVKDEDTGATFELTRDVGEPMWAGVRTREDLAKIAGQVGDAAYAAEYMSDPADRKGGLLKRPLPAVFLNPDAEPRARVVRCPDGAIIPVSAMTIAAALDPQFAAEEESADPDLAAVAVVGQYQARTFILDSWIGRDRHGQAGILVERALAWGAFAAAVEVNAAQVLVADEAAAFGSMAIIPERSTDGKAARALSLAVRLGQGRVFVLTSQGHNEQLPGYIVAFPNGRYDDPVDAVVMATNVATRATPPTSGGGAVAR
jgi:phage terminase large subunit-like protein